EASKPPRKTPRILARRPPGLVRRLRRSEGAPNVKSLKSRATATATATSPQPRRAGLDPPYEATVAVSPTRREQEQLAALAPSSGASRHLLPQAGEGLVGWSPAGGRRAGRLVSCKREKGWSAGLLQAGE